MTDKTRTRMVIGIIGLCVVLTMAVKYVIENTAGRPGKIQGTIVELDVAGRRGILECVHPKNGKVIRLDGELAEDCDIRIDGEPADFADLRVGEKVSAEGMLYARGAVVATSLEADRTPEPSSQPADQQAKADTGPKADPIP